MSDRELLDAITPAIEKLNRDSQDHARIPRHMLVPLPHQAPLERSSKGTLIRRVAEARFEEIINRAYDEQDSNESGYISDDELPQHLKDLIQSVPSSRMVWTPSRVCSSALALEASSLIATSPCQ
jgi:hypothetical protein